MKNKEAIVDYSQKVLEVKDLKRYFYSGAGKNKLVIPAVDGVTFDVHKREVFGLVGESGCGKTTTGRTLIKLYSPTDGEVKLDGIEITGGYRTNLKNISDIKEERRLKILSLNERLKLKAEIKAEYDVKIKTVKLDIDRVKNEYQTKIDKLKEYLVKYNERIYDLYNKYLIDADKIKYSYAIKREDIRNEMNNASKLAFDDELEMMTNIYKRKVEGLKESSALSSDMIKDRIAELTDEFNQNKEELQSKYASRIEEDQKNLLDKKIGHAKIKELKKLETEEITKLKEKFEADSLKFEKPDETSHNEEIKNLRVLEKKEIEQLNAKIKALKAEMNAKIKALPKTDSIKDTFVKHRKQIFEIRKEAKEKISAEKRIIENKKAINKSQDALETSRKMQMIFQDPISSLNPRMTVKEIIGEGLKILGKHTQEEIDAKVAEVLKLVGLLPEYATRYPHEFSGGQRQRIGVARALIMEPSVIIADEPISALDVSISAQVINLLSELRERLGLTILFIAHDLSVVKFFCDRIAVMYYGKIVELAPSEDLFANPLHPYTKSLLSAIPEPDPNYEKGRKRFNYDPSMHDYRFDKPSMREIYPGHSIYVNDAEFKEIQKSLKAKKANK